MPGQKITIIGLILVLGCSRAAPAPAPLVLGDAAAPSTTAAPVAVASPSSVAPAIDAAKEPPKIYKRVLHTGDSMVGGGLSRALRPKVEAEGAKYFRDVWESGSLRAFSRSDRIPKLMKELHPDLVILSLGANDVYEPNPEAMAAFVERIAKMTAGTDCWWLGPPIWKAEYKPFVQMIKEHVAPCTFFDASDIDMERKKDGIHPDEKGGETWALAFWMAFRGVPGAATSPDAGPALVVGK